MGVALSGGIPHHTPARGEGPSIPDSGFEWCWFGKVLQAKSHTRDNQIHFRQYDVLVGPFAWFLAASVLIKECSLACAWVGRWAG